MSTQRPALRFIPSSDPAFTEHVQRLAASQPFATPADLAARLRRLFPRVLVRPSEVSGQTGVWYVYRDGVWRPSTEAPWWEDRRSPRVVVSKEGWITDANSAARAMLGLGPSDALPRFFSDFVAPGTLDDATALFAVVAAGHELTATTLMRPSGGEVIACDLRAWTEGDAIVGALRLATDIPAQGVASSTPPSLDCHPSSDILFTRYAQEVLGRMSEPTPDGLALRLRRLYPHARVDAAAGVWTVTRDGGAEGPGELPWWHDPSLPSVAYDVQGLIHEANEPALEVLGEDLAGRHWHELVTLGTTDEIARILRLLAEAGSAVSRFRLPRGDGFYIEFDSYTEVSGERYRTVMRPG